MKHYIVSCRISSSALPSGGVGDPSVSKVYSEKVLKPVEKNIPYLISQKKVFEFKDEETAKLELEKLNAVDGEIVEPQVIDEDHKIIEDSKVEETAIADISEKVEEITKANDKNISHNKKKNKKNK